MTMRSWIWAVGAASVALLTGCGSVDLNPPASPANPLDSEEQALIDAVDALRAQKGITAKLLVCTTLNTSTSAHSDDQRDNAYLSDTAPDGTTPRQRACAAGYKPGCGTNLAMAELVASGLIQGAPTVQQWAGDTKTSALMLDGSFIVAGVGRAVQGKAPIWTLDLASLTDPSCK